MMDSAWRFAQGVLLGILLWARSVDNVDKSTMGAGLIAAGRGLVSVDNVDHLKPNCPHCPQYGLGIFQMGMGRG
jgi:hypothetical protein